MRSALGEGLTRVAMYLEDFSPARAKKNADRLVSEIAICAGGGRSKMDDPKSEDSESKGHLYEGLDSEPIGSSPWVSA